MSGAPSYPAPGEDPEFDEIVAKVHAAVAEKGEAPIEDESVRETVMRSLAKYGGSRWQLDKKGEPVSTFVVAVGTVDGEVKVNQVGDQHKKVANFRIATNPGWYSVAAWEKLADQVPPAGTFIIVTGKLSGRSYDKTVGGETVKIPVVEIVASTIEVIGGATPADDSLFE
jgi:hypothetical protein